MEFKAGSLVKPRNVTVQQCSRCAQAGWRTIVGYVNQPDRAQMGRC